MHYVWQTNALDGDDHNHCDAPYRALDDNVGDDDEPYDKSKLDDDGDTSSSDPNIDGRLRNGMDATKLANNPNNMVNASIPNEDPRTNHRLLVDRYKQAQ